VRLEDERACGAHGPGAGAAAIPAVELGARRKLVDVLGKESADLQLAVGDSLELDGLGSALGRGQDELRAGDPVGAARISRLGARTVHSRGIQRSAGDGVEISAVRSEEVVTLLEPAERELHLEEKTVEA